ncbi:hypothetical protein FRB94_008609 [Tulasnella sp. JGI-2019a]|nr:hypothetical protein FRB94_008609 [Tulasnella sp. JGI-2019a]
MTWRLFIIWSRDMRVIYLPIVLLTASGVNCIMVVFYDVFRISRFGDLSFSARYEMIVAAALAVDILLTWYLTGFICFRIWSVQQQNRAVAGIIPFDELSSRGDGYGQTRSRYENIMMSLMQSGMLYSINMAALLGCVLARDSSGRMESFGKDILNLLNSKVIGITSVLIMLQLNNGTSSCKIQQQGQIGASVFSMPVFRVIHAENDSQGTAESFPGKVDTSNSGKLAHSPTTSKSSPGADVRDDVV